MKVYLKGFFIFPEIFLSILRKGNHRNVSASINVNIFSPEMKVVPYSADFCRFILSLLVEIFKFMFA